MSKSKSDKPGCMEYLIGGILFIVIVGGIIGIIWGKIKTTLGFEEEKTVLTDSSGIVYPDESEIPYYQYSEEKRANRVISYYNFFYDKAITKDMVKYENYNHTEIKFGDITFIMSISDGDDMYRLEAKMDNNEENEKEYLNMLKKVIHASYPMLSEKTIQSEIIDKMTEDKEGGSVYDYIINSSKHHFSYIPYNGGFKASYGEQSW